MRVETVEVFTEDGKDRLIINKEDYDAEKHKLWNSTAIPPEQPSSAIIPAAPVGFDANGNPVNAGDGGQMVPAQAPVQPSSTEYLVTKSGDGKKFVVIDKNAMPVQREGIDPAGYKTEKAAWDAVGAL